MALLRFSASSLKSAPRDHWIGWDARLLFGWLKLIANNSRFLILPDLHQPCLGSKVRALPESFQAIGEPRRAQGRRHPIRAVLGNRRRGLQVHVHVHVMSAVGHESRAQYTQKESPA